jgi:hypothetical protein
VATPARVQITEAATAAGWTTDRGYRGPEAEKSAAWSGTGPDGQHLNVQFSAAGGLTWACGADDFGRTQDENSCAHGRFDGPGRLARVLAYIRGA